MTSPESSDWEAGWEATERRQLLAGAALTPQQRLAWLEEAVLFAYRAGALPIPRDPWTGQRLPPHRADP